MPLLRARRLLAVVVLGAAFGAGAVEDPDLPDSSTDSTPQTEAETAADESSRALSLLGVDVAPGTRQNLRWIAGQSFSGSDLRAPVMVVHGEAAGPALCLTGGVHGDELNGVEIVRRVLAETTPGELRGTLIGVPIVNLMGFSSGSRYLPDRRDLNRFFPGHPRGNAASRIAHAFFNEVVRHCDLLIDLHTGSFKRSNLPQLRANLDHAAVAEFVTHFGATAVLHHSRERGTLRDAANAAGIAAVTFELGEPGTVQAEYVRYGVKAINTVLGRLDMLDRSHIWLERQPIYFRSRWVRAYHGGILSSPIELGTTVDEGDLLGTVINPLTNEEAEIRAPYSGRILGRALDQFVLPGFATFHIGIETDTPAAQGTEIPDPQDLSADDMEAPEGSADETGVDAFIEDSLAPGAGASMEPLP
ncbi:MAG: succinylglutamate desuccinylase/aspartoacylase family protein [Gammaproteobacteria bacterium]